MIKPQIRQSRTVASWKREVRLCWIYLWESMDNYGRVRDDLLLLKAELFPFDRDVTEAKLDGWFVLMASTKLGPHDQPPLCRYEVGGQRFMHAVNWDLHQRLSHPGNPEAPPCPVHDSLRNDAGTVPEDFRKPSGTVPKASTVRSEGPSGVSPEREIEVEEEVKTPAPAPPAPREQDQLFSPQNDHEKPRRQRPSDPLFEAVVAACRLDASKLTTAQRGSLNGALGQLRSVGASVAEVHDAAGRFHAWYAERTLTPTALVRHWAQLVAAPDPPRESQPTTGQAWPGYTPSWQESR